MANRNVLIVGGGASGVVVAARLARASSEVRMTIVEPREHLGRGMAYSTTHDEHVLNVPAARMSAHVDDPAHFITFLQDRYPGAFDGGAFVPRRIYGEYLGSIAHEHARRVTHVRAQALAAAADERGVRLILDDGQSVAGDVLVLATGNADPAPWYGASSDIASGPRFFSSVWQPGALAVPPDEDVLLLGTGLTAVDAVLALRANGLRSTISMISRRGLLPHEHRVFDAPPDANPDASSMHDLLSAVRAVSGRPRAWRAALDSLRPHTNRLWQSLSVNDQRRFVRHVMPYWNVHRHRMAPAVAQKMADAIASGALRMLAGRTGRLEATPRGIRVPIVTRDAQKRFEIEVGRVINSSGPAHDPRVIDNPLIGNLLAQGLMRPAALGIGLDVAATGAVRDRDGVDSPRIFAIGPVRYGTLIETTAMPEIRAQADELAAHLVH